MRSKMDIVKKWVFIVMLFCFLSSFQSVQTLNNDSLYEELLKLDNTTKKVDELLALARKSAVANPDQALSLANLAKQISYEISYEKGKTDVLYEFAVIKKVKGDIDSALIFNERFTKISDSLGEIRNLAKGFYQYANLITKKGKKDIAYEYLRKSEKYFNVLNDTFCLTAVYNSIGNYFENTANLDSAAFYYLKTIKLCENSKNEKDIGTVLINLGKVYLGLGNHQLAKQYVNRGIEINTEYNNLSNVALAYTILGNIANAENETTKAINYYKDAESIYLQMNNSIGINNLYINNGEIYKKQGKDSLALVNYDFALKYSYQSVYTSGIVAATKNKAAIFIKQKKFMQAAMLLDTCLVYALKANDKESRKDIYLYFSTIHSELGNFKQAFRFLNMYGELKDSIDITNKEATIADLTLKYGLEKKQSEILSLQNKNLAQENALRKRTNQRNAYLFSGLAIILLVSTVSGYFRNRALHEKIVSEQRIKQLEDEKKLLAVRFLVEGQEEERKRIAKEMHDGIGVLLATAKMQFSSISNVNPESKLRIEKATKLLEQATSDVRKITHNMMPGLLTKFGFFDAVEDLIEQLDDAGTISAKVVIEGEPFRFLENKEIMLYRIVQEMVHNTIKHAKATSINLVLEILPQQLNLVFADNGQGFDVATKLQNQSIGLTSIQSRVSFLDGVLDINSAPGTGTTFRIKVPLS